MSDTYIITAIEDHISMGIALRESGLPIWDEDDRIIDYDLLVDATAAIAAVVDRRAMSYVGASEAISESETGTYQAMGWTRADTYEVWGDAWDIDVVAVTADLA